MEMNLMKIVGEANTLNNLKESSSLWVPQNEHEAVTMKACINLFGHINKPVTKNILNFLDTEVGVKEDYFNSGGLKMKRTIRREKVYEPNKKYLKMLEDLKKMEAKVKAYEKTLPFKEVEGVVYRVY